MPTSMSEGKDWSLRRFQRHLPDTVTDVGPGEGLYARLLRPHHRGLWWTGIEIHKPYITKYRLRSTKRAPRYDELHVADALLRHIHTAGAWHILVSLPIVPMPQGEMHGNPHEAHVHHWDADDMDHVLAELGGTVEAMRGDVLGVWWWSRRT